MALCRFCVHMSDAVSPKHVAVFGAEDKPH